MCARTAGLHSSTGSSAARLWVVVPGPAPRGCLRLNLSPCKRLLLRSGGRCRRNLICHPLAAEEADAGNASGCPLHHGLALIIGEGPLFFCYGHDQMHALEFADTRRPAEFAARRCHRRGGSSKECCTQHCSAVEMLKCGNSRSNRADTDVERRFTASSGHSRELLTPGLGLQRRVRLPKRIACLTPRALPRAERCCPMHDIVNIVKMRSV